MEDDDIVCKFLEIFFDIDIKDSVDKKTRRSSYPPYLLTAEFRQSMTDVLSAKLTILNCRWHNLFDSCCLKMLSSHEMYLQHVVYACFKEHECNQNIFESFISVCLLLRSLSFEIIDKTGINFCGSNPFIFLAFYKNVLRKVFHRRGGFQRLVKYILEHKYITWKYQRKDLSSPGGSNVPNDDVNRVLAEKFMKELKKEQASARAINFDEILSHETSAILASSMLIGMRDRLPPLPSYGDLVMKLVDYRKKEISKKKTDKALEGAFQEKSCLSTDSKTNFVSKQKENKLRNENIIQAVIKYNHSKHPVQAKSNNRIQEEADVILKHLQDTIKSLIQTIDEYGSA